MQILSRRASLEDADEGVLVGANAAAPLHIRKQRECLSGEALLDKTCNEECPRENVLVRHFIEQLAGVGNVPTFDVGVDEMVVDEQGI